jgi:hypothetical protein
VAKGNQVHEYYNLPFILPAVVFVAKSFSQYFDIRLLKRIKTNPPVAWLFLLFLTVGIILSFLRYDRFMNSETYDSSLFSLARSVGDLTHKNDLIITVDDGNPIVLYRCDRKGWNAYVEQIDSTFISERVEKGAKYIVGENSNFDNRIQTFEYLFANYKILERTNDYFILDLRK